VEHFNLLVTTCPPGHALYSTDVEDEYECKCDDDNDQNIIRCLLDERRLIIKVYTHMWIFMTCIYNMAIITIPNVKLQ